MPYAWSLRPCDSFIAYDTEVSAHVVCYAVCDAHRGIAVCLLNASKLTVVLLLGNVCAVATSWRHSVYSAAPVFFAIAKNCEGGSWLYVPAFALNVIQEQMNSSLRRAG